jgi:N-acetylmuramoyl-L-alanine amidase
MAGAMARNLPTARGVLSVVLIAALCHGCRTGKTRDATPLPDLEHNRPRPEASASAPPAAAPEPNLQSAKEGWIPAEGWARNQGLAPVVLMSSNSPDACVIGTLERMLTLVPGTRQAQWNGIACWLVMHIHQLDARKTLLPLLATSFWTPPRGGTIVLDPGHGGRDPGARSVVKPTWEKDYTLDWAIRTRRLLQAQGWKVVLTRETDLDLSLIDRVRIADAQAADLFISLHFNSAEPNRAMEGIETYCLPPAGVPSTLQRLDQEDWTQAWPNNGFDAQNVQIAQRVHSALVDLTGAQDRGVRRARFMTVLREQQRPAILIEGGYLSNAGEADRIDTAAFRQQLAGAVAQAFR